MESKIKITILIIAMVMFFGGIFLTISTKNFWWVIPVIFGYPILMTILNGKV